MGLEKIGLEVLEQGFEHLRLSENLLKPLWKIASKLEEFANFGGRSPWKDVTTKIAKNGNKVTVGQAGAKAIEDKLGNVRLSRKLSSVLEAPDGSPVLRYSVHRPSGHTYLYAKLNPNGKISPMRF